MRRTIAYSSIPYRYLGKSLQYRPDFLVKLANDEMLLIEGKGCKDEKDDVSHPASRKDRPAAALTPDHVSILLGALTTSSIGRFA